MKYKSAKPKPVNQPHSKPTPKGAPPAQPQQKIAPPLAWPRFYLRAPQVWAIALLSLVFAAVSSWPLSHNDIWTHLSFGRWIFDRGGLPVYGLFLTIENTEPYIPQLQWLGQLLLYGFYSLGESAGGSTRLEPSAAGVEVLRLAFGLLVVARLSLALTAMRYRANSFTLGCAGLLLVLVLSSMNLLDLRPQVFGEICLAVILLLLSKPLLSASALIAMVLTMAFWANCHGSFFVGLIVIALVLAGRWADGFRFGKDSQMRRLALGLGMSIVASLLNPHREKLMEVILIIWKSPYLSVGVEEWQPLHFGWQWGGHWIFLLSVAAAVVTHLKSPRGISPGDTLLIVVFGIACCVHQRMLTWWALILPWVLSRYWGEIGNASAPAFTNFQGTSSLRNLLAAAAIVLATLAWTAISWLAPTGEPARLQKELDVRTPWQIGCQLKPLSADKVRPFPRLESILEESYPDGRFRGKAFVSPTMGDYFFWQLSPEILVTRFSHVHLFAPEQLYESEAVLNVKNGWWEILDRWQVNIIVLEVGKHPELQRRIEALPGWEVIHRGGPVPTAEFGRFQGWIAVRKRPVGDDRPSGQ